MWRHLKLPMIVVVGGLGLWAAGAAFSKDAVTSRPRDIDGKQAGEVLVGDRVVILLRTSAGGYTPVERAEVVADRLGKALSEEVEAEQVRVAPVTWDDVVYQAVYIGERLIVSVSQKEADAHEAAPEALAGLWRDNIILALGETPPPPETPEAPAEPVPGTEEQEVQPIAVQPQPAAVDWTGTAQKWVPIFSLETEGAAIGAAQVAGPKSQVDKVKAVAELRLKFQNIGRIYAYIPVPAISTKLDRVQGVSVWAVGDVQLVEF